MSLLPDGMPHRDWFRFSDRENPGRHPAAGTMILTCGLSHESRGLPTDPEWEREEWSVHACLVPLGEGDEANAVLATVLSTVTLYQVEFRPWWRDARTFEFGEAVALDGVSVLPWVHTRRHPVTEVLLIEPRADFVRYHALERRTDGAFVHVLDGISALETSVDTHGLYDPTARVTVHRDYLRDYLAARRAALVISVVADRFANLPAGAEADFAIGELERVDDSAWLTTVVHPARDTAPGATMVRGTLYWNILVPPYPAPKPRRSPWPCFDASTDVSEEDGPPMFVADAEGRRVHLSDPACPPYLYFKAQVLEKYLTTSGYAVAFHMRTWGRATGPGPDHAVDVGMNSKGMVTAYAPDLTRLSAQESWHWAHYTSLPSGEWCEELVQTRMMNRPPDSPGIVTLIANDRQAASDAYAARFGRPLVRERELTERDRARLSVGPVRGDDQELCDLAVPLAEWTIAGIDISALRAPLDAEGCHYDTDAKQLKLLFVLMTGVLALPDAQARSLLGPFHGVNDLRVAAAHRTGRNLTEMFARMGASTEFSTTRAAWMWLVERLSRSFQELAEAVATRLPEDA